MTDDQYSVSGENVALFLGGGDVKHKYLIDCFNNQSTDNKTITYERLYSTECHKNGPHSYYQGFKNLNKKIIAICPLVDSLIPFTDRLNALCNLPHNNTNTSEIRRNKALMHKTIYQADIMQQTHDDTILQSSAAKTSNVLRFGKFFELYDKPLSKQSFEQKMISNNLKYPIVVKPLTSGGTDGVRMCSSFSAVDKVLDRFLHQMNCEGNMNSSMMIQEFLDGEEYVVNTVSDKGVAKITDIWRAFKSYHIPDYYQSNGIKSKFNNIMNGVFGNSNESEMNENANEFPSAMLYDYQQFIPDPMSSVKHALICTYALRVLHVLGVEYGSGHMEVMYLPAENDVCLIELNARLHGGFPRSNHLVGYDQLSVLALSHINLPAFHELPTVYKVVNKDESNTNNDSENVETIVDSMESLVIENVENKENIKEDEQKNSNVDDDDDQNLITVRTIFLQSSIDGRMDFLKLFECEKLKTFKQYARSLYINAGIWKDMKLKLNECENKLSEIAIFKESIGGNIANEIAQSINVQREVNEKQYERCRKYMSRMAEVKRTTDLITSKGGVVLSGRVCDIEKDYQTVREWERDLENGFYVPL